MLLIPQGINVKRLLSRRLETELWVRAEEQSVGGIYGITRGPFVTLQSAKDASGRIKGDCIIKMTHTGGVFGTELVARWNRAEARWEDLDAVAASYELTLYAGDALTYYLGLAQGTGRQYLSIRMTDSVSGTGDAYAYLDGNGDIVVDGTSLQITGAGLFAALEPLLDDYFVVESLAINATDVQFGLTSRAAGETSLSIREVVNRLAITTEGEGNVWDTLPMIVEITHPASAATWTAGTYLDFTFGGVDYRCFAGSGTDAVVGGRQHYYGATVGSQSLGLWRTAVGKAGVIAVAYVTGKMVVFGRDSTISNVSVYNPAQMTLATLQAARP